MPPKTETNANSTEVLIPIELPVNPLEASDQVSEQLLTALAEALFPEHFKIPDATAHPERRLMKDVGMATLHTVGLASAGLILYAIYLRAGQGADLLINYFELDEDQANTLRVLIPASTVLGNFQQYVNGNITQLTLLINFIRRLRNRPAALEYRDYSVPSVFSQEYYSRNGLFRPAMPNIILKAIVSFGASFISILPNLGIVLGSATPTPFEIFNSFNAGFVTSRLNKDALEQWYDRLSEWLTAFAILCKQKLGNNPHIQKVPSLNNLLKSLPKTLPQEIKIQLQQWVKIQMAIANYLPEERRPIVTEQIRRIIKTLPAHPAFTKNPEDFNKIIPVIFTYFTHTLPPLAYHAEYDLVAIQQIESVLKTESYFWRKTFIFSAVAILLYSSIATVGNAWRALDNPALAWLEGAKEFIKWCSWICIFALSSNFTYDQLTQLMLPNKLPYIVSQTYSKTFYSILSFFLIGVLFSYGVSVESMSRFISRSVCEPDTNICPEVANYSPWILLTMIISVLNNMIVSRYGLSRTLNIATGFLSNDSSVMNRYYLDMLRLSKWLSDIPSEQLYSLLLFSVKHCPENKQEQLNIMFSAMGLKIASDKDSISVITNKKFFDPIGLPNPAAATSAPIRFSSPKNYQSVRTDSDKHIGMFFVGDGSPQSRKSSSDREGSPSDTDSIFAHEETPLLIDDDSERLERMLQQSRKKTQSKRCAIL